MTHQVEEGRKSFEPKKKAPAHNLKLSAPSISWFKKRSPFKYVYVPASCLGPTSKAGLINFGMFAAGKMNLLRYPVKEENKIKLRKIMADCMDELLKEEEEEKEPSKSMKNMEVHKRKIVEMKPDGTLLEEDDEDDILSGKKHHKHAHSHFNHMDKVEEEIEKMINSLPKHTSTPQLEDTKPK